MSSAITSGDPNLKSFFHGTKEFHDPFVMNSNLYIPKDFYKNVEYKIMAVKDYSDYGHIEYHCIKDWQNNAD